MRRGSRGGPLTWVLLVVAVCVCLKVGDVRAASGFKCPQKSGLFPAGSGSSCGKYYECSRGEPVLRSCPDQQGFHSLWRQCTWQGFVPSCTTGGGSRGQAFCGVVDGDDNAAAAGSDDSRKETPWVAAVFQRDRMDQDWEFTSAGVIVSPTSIITSCRLGRKINEKWRFNMNASSFQVVVGVESLDLTVADEHAQVFGVTSVQMNPKASPLSYDNCNSVLHLQKPISFDGSYARPLCLPIFRKGSKAEKTFGYSGFGKISAYKEKRKDPDGYSHLITTSVRLTGQPYCYAHSFQWNKYCGVSSGGSSANLVEICMAHQTVSATQSNNKRWYALAYGSHFNNDVCGMRKLEEDSLLPWISSSLKCGRTKFPCRDGTCIELDRVCNNENDCSKGEDENPSTCRAMNPCISDENTFECGVYENCIKASKVCDGYPDCYDASDESPELCRHTKRKNNVPFFVSTSTEASTIADFDTTEQSLFEFTDASATTSSYLSNAGGSGSGTADVIQPKVTLPPPTVSPSTAPPIRKCPKIEVPEGTILSCAVTGSSDLTDCPPGFTTLNGSADVGTITQFRCNNFYRSAIPGQESLIKKCTGEGNWRPERNLICIPDCGRLPTSTNAYIVNGQKANSHDRFPWHVAIFVKSRRKNDFVCGGTLIRRSYVLTAAHCVTDYNGENTRNPDIYTVALAPSSSSYGKIVGESDARLFKVKKIMVNPHYDPSNNYQSDIALLALSRYAELDEKINIACLPSKDSYDPAPGTMGKVPGFGYDETGNISDELKFANLPIVGTDACKEAVNFVPSTNQFCAGYTNGTGVCFGDSGGGLVVLRNDDRFYLQGIVSVGPKVNRRERDLSCDHSTYSVYTSVPRFAEWIDSQINVVEMDGARD